MSKNEVLIKNNRPVIGIDGSENMPVLYGLSDIPASASNTAQASKNIKNFSKVGIDFVSADSELRLGWHKITPYDSEAVYEEIKTITDYNKNAKVLLRLHLNPPYWWMRDNPDECVVYRTEKGDFKGLDDGDSDRLIRNDGEARFMRVSLASKLWREQAGEKLKLLMTDLKNSDIADNLLGIQVACGIYGEWHQWGIDVSKPMKNYFKAYLKNKYKSDCELKNAWNNKEVTFDSAQFKPEYFALGDDGAFRDPKISRNIIDSQEALQHSVVDAILYFCKIIKSVNSELLCGAFYGYYFNTGEDNKTTVGHLFPEQLYNAKDMIDFICGPFAYYDNRNLDGYPMQRGMLESSRLNGTLWLTEMDQHPYGTENFVGGDVEKLPETVSVLRRNTLQPLLSGQGFWYYDHRIIPSLCIGNSSAGSVYRKNGWWDTPELMNEISEIKRFSDKLLNKEHCSLADVLLVYDTKSYFYRATVREEEYLLHKNIMSKGFLFDCIYAEDLDKCNIENYKCVIFVNCYKISEAEREKYRRITKDKMRIFLCDSGYCDGETLSQDNISKSVGINMKKVTCCDGSLSFKNGEKFELKKEFSPYFTICDDAVEPLGYFENGEVACAIKGNDVYIPLPYIPEFLVEALFKKSDVHRWLDSGEPVFGGGGYIAIHCTKLGERNLYLPNGKKISVKNDKCKSVLFDIKTGEMIM